MSLSYPDSERSDDPSCPDRVFRSSSFLQATRIFVASAILGLISPHQTLAADVSSRTPFSQVVIQPSLSYVIFQETDPPPHSPSPSDFPFAVNFGVTGSPDFRTAPLMSLAHVDGPPHILRDIINGGIFSPSTSSIQSDGLERPSMKPDIPFVSGNLALSVGDDLPYGVSDHHDDAFLSRFGLKAHVTFSNNSSNHANNSGDNFSAGSFIDIGPSKLEVDATAIFFHRFLSSVFRENFHVGIGAEVCLTCPESDVGIGVSFILKE